MATTYYLCFSVNKLPDLTLTKYSVFDASSVESIMDKHGVFLRQLHRLGYTSGVYFHLLYYYNPDKSIPKGHHLSIIFYATSQDQSKLEGIREFLTTSVLSNYYEFFCYEVAKDFEIEEEPLADGSTIPVLRLTNISGNTRKYGLGKIKTDLITEAKQSISSGKRSHIVCEIASDADVILSFNKMPVDSTGRITLEKRFAFGAFVTKKDYSLPAQNRLNTDGAGEIPLYSILEWEPCETGRLYNVLKLMEGYDRHAVLRVDIFPVEHTQAIRQKLPYAETRRRISDRVQGKDDNSETIIKSWDKYLNNLMKFPQFRANVVAFADSSDVAVMLADSIAAEAVESGTYLIETMSSPSGFDMYESDSRILHRADEPGNYMLPILSLYTLEEIRPMFSFPILYPGESIECQKETDPIPFPKELSIDKDTGEMHEVISLGTSSMGYDVTFPVKLFKKHAFIAGVPGAGKTNTMLYLVTTLWRDTEQHIPFLVLEPAKQEYRALALQRGMEGLCVFSPGADTKFPLHINPFQFPIGLTLAEHIANLNAVFAGAFELPPPSPHFIDSCIEKVYLNKGWNINERNTGKREYPTLQELYESLEVAVKESHYQGETLGNLQSVLEVRVGSLLKREIGNVYNVRHSIIEPEEWLKRPVIIELEALGEGPANFMSLLISTLIREVLKVKKTSDIERGPDTNLKKEVEHIIFYEEAHNLIGPNTDSPMGDSVDPKISATKFLVKMLAEVRALGEGIVIADQLPTVMAPEVLKNTGLKIGHRITAQDDRNLLGSTMSASADQLEEQGTFGTGQALIFYENLLKPFKMRVCEWEKGVSQKKYDSPTNQQLFESLKNNANYNILLNKSASIMQEKMRSEFDVQRRQAEALKTDISKKEAELKTLRGNISLLEAKLARQSTDDERATIKKQIADLQLALEKKNGEIIGSLSRRIKRLCWEYANLYYAYMTLSKNYYVYENDMYMCTINNYLSLFKILKSLHESPWLKEILISETQSVIDDIKRYVDFEECSESAVLVDHPGYLSAIHECGNYWISIIDNEAEGFQLRAEEILKRNRDADASVQQLSEDLSASFDRYLKIAQHYQDITEKLCQSLRNDLANKYLLDTPEWDETNKKLVEYSDRKYALHKALAAFVVGIFRKLSGLQGTNRLSLLRGTNDLRKAFCGIVNYRNKTATALLSKWSRYREIQESATIITFVEMMTHFSNAYQQRVECYKTLLMMDSLEEKKKKILELCQTYSALYQLYSSYDVDTFEYEYSLTNYYATYLIETLNLGVVAHDQICAANCGCWTKCANTMKKLIQDDRLSSSKRNEWIKLSNRMKQIME